MSIALLSKIIIFADLANTSYGWSIRRCHGNVHSTAMENRVLRALKSRTKSLCFDLSSLKELPTAIGRLDFLQSLSAKNNSLQTLPQEICQLREVCVCERERERERETAQMTMIPITHDVPLFLYLQLRYLNLGCNEIQVVPDCLITLASLQTLHLFNNNISSLPTNFTRES